MALQLTTEEWGQKHCITIDPNNILIDIIEKTAPSDEFLKNYSS